MPKRSPSKEYNAMGSSGADFFNRSNKFKNSSIFTGQKLMNTENLMNSTLLSQGSTREKKKIPINNEVSKRVFQEFLKHQEAK